MILKLLGQVDREPEREWESFVVTEDDHIDYLAQADISSLVPVTLVARLRRSHFLFLGYPLRDWGLRVFLHRIWGREKVALPLLGRRAPRATPSSASSGASAASTCSTFRSTSTSAELRIAAGRGCSVTDEIGCPYKGLAPFEDSDHDVLFFFGREREREMIGANLMASRLTVLYGETGVGKSSVLRAGVAHHLRRTGEPRGVVVFDAWKDDPAQGLDGRPCADGRTSSRGLAGGHAGALRGEGSAASVYVILDGCRGVLPLPRGRREVRVVLRGVPGGRPAARDCGRASCSRSARTRSRSSIASRASIPNLFGNYLRLDHLDLERRHGTRSSARSSGTTSSSARTRRSRSRPSWSRPCSTRSPPGRSISARPGAAWSEARGRRPDRDAVPPARHAAALGGRAARRTRGLSALRRSRARRRGADRARSPRARARAR